MYIVQKKEWGNPLFRVNIYVLPTDVGEHFCRIYIFCYKFYFLNLVILRQIFPAQWQGLLLANEKE